MSVKNKYAKYCFKKCQFWDASFIKYEEKMYHTYTCLDDLPKVKAWENIENNHWFDIKLYDDVQTNEYLDVMQKLSEISTRKRFTVHFSNHASEPLNDKIKSTFFELLNKLQPTKTIDLQFQHKIISNTKEKYYIDVEFFNEIIEFCRNHKKIKLDTLSTLSIDEQEEYYYLLDKSHESCILE